MNSIIIISSFFSMTVMTGQNRKLSETKLASIILVTTENKRKNIRVILAKAGVKTVARQPSVAVEDSGSLSAHCSHVGEWS